MTENTVALTVEDGCYHLTDSTTTAPLLYHTGSNGLVGVLGDGAACVCTGTLTGYVRVTAQAVQEPPAADLNAWDEIVEVTFNSPGGSFRPASPEGALLPNPASAGAGLYRLRLHARGRDAGHRDETARDIDRIVEEHLIVAWPIDEAEPETVIQTRDVFGAHLRARPSDPSAMPPADPMTAGGIDMSEGGRRATGMSLDSTRRIHFD